MGLDEFLLEKVTDEHIGIPLPDFTKESVRHKLRERIKTCRLFVHSFSFYHNFTKGQWGPGDMLDFSEGEDLQGINIKIHSGKKKSLANKSNGQLASFGDRARALGLGINLEITNTSNPDVQRAIEIATAVQAERIRCYIRNKSNVLLSKMIKDGTKSLQSVANLAQKNDVYFDLEIHEALKSHEIVGIIESVGSKRLRALFDLGNPPNAGEYSPEALQIMARYIKQVHLKTMKYIVDDHPDFGTGYGQLGVLDGDDELPQAKLMLDLLMLGDGKHHQVESFVVQQEHGYFGPARRFTNEPDDPLIIRRGESTKPLEKGYSVEQNCIREIKHAHQSIRFYRGLLSQLHVLTYSS